MKNLKKICKNGFVTKIYRETPPYRVQEYDLLNGELYIADDYDFIIANHYGNPIVTNYGDPEEVLDGNFYGIDIYERTMCLINEMKKSGQKSDPPAEEVKFICDKLGDKPQGLKMCRLYAGMTQGELAAKSGVAQQAISGYENGKKDIRQARACTIKDIADSLGVSMEDIIA